VAANAKVTVAGSQSRRPLQDEASASLSHPSGIVAGMEASGSVRYRRAIMRVVTPTSIAGQLNEVRQAAAAFGVDAVVDALERTAQEALAVARTEQESEMARQLLAVARQTRVRRSLHR